MCALGVTIYGSTRVAAGTPAARIGDYHTCPRIDRAVPHVGGPITTGATTVLIGGMAAARMSDHCSCAGPTDKIAVGSATVLIEGMPAARMGDATAHGGTIIEGEATVLIGP